MKYFDKTGTEIKAGMYIRMSDGSIELVYPSFLINWLFRSYSPSLLLSSLAVWNSEPQGSIPSVRNCDGENKENATEIRGKAYFSIRSSIVQPSAFARRKTVSAPALLMSLLRCSYISMFSITEVIDCLLKYQKAQNFWLDFFLHKIFRSAILFLRFLYVFLPKFFKSIDKIKPGWYNISA